MRSTSSKRRPPTTTTRPTSRPPIRCQQNGTFLFCHWILHAQTHRRRPLLSSPSVTLNGHTFHHSPKLRWLDVFFQNNLSPAHHIATRWSKASQTLQRIRPLLRSLRMQQASQLAKALVLSIAFFGFGIFASNAVNYDAATPLRLLLRDTARAITSAFIHSETRAHCSEASLPTAKSLLCSLALSSSCCLMTLPAEHPLHPLLPWNQTTPLRNKAGIRLKDWTKTRPGAGLSQPHLDALLSQAYRFADTEVTPPLLPKPVTANALEWFSINNFANQQNPPHLYSPQHNTNTGGKGLLYPSLARRMAQVKLSHGFIPSTLLVKASIPANAPGARTATLTATHTHRLQKHAHQHIRPDNRYSP